MSRTFNLADLFEIIADAVPDRTAVVAGEQRRTYRELDDRATRLANHLHANGVNKGDHVAVHAMNCAEWVEAFFACFKLSAVPINVNYRYVEAELRYLYDNADSIAVIVEPQFRERLDAVLADLPGVRHVLEIGPDYEAALAAASPERPNLGRSNDDLYMLYTGGTTGMPKGVMWAQDDLREITLAAARKLGPVPETLGALAVHAKTVGPMGRILPAPPLMHGTGLLTGMGTMMTGGTVITLEGATFDAEELLDAIHRHKPQTLVIVGDSFGRPILNALNANPDRWDVSSVLVIVSSGVMWSYEVKQGMLEHMPQAVLSDGFSSSEALGMGQSMMAKGVEVQTARFVLGERCRVFDENDNPVEPGSGVPGIVAIGPPNPVGYYKDEEKTARTFRTIGGVRYSIPGDWCVVEADGTLTLLGRGNACINTAGEKVFPEEVEEALKTHPSVEDALVVGLPDEKWGQAVTGVVTLADGAALDEAGLRAHVRRSLAGYKTPKRIVIADRDLRTANGKADYPAARASAELQLSGRTAP